jgi:RNA polymerase sigma factor (sigma-70 family)
VEDRATIVLSSTDEKKSLPELVGQAVQGDPDSVEKLLSVSAKIVYAKVRAALNRDMEAEDVAQEVLLRALVGLKQLRSPDSYLGWLRRIADNVIIDRIHNNRRHRVCQYEIELIADPRRNTEAIVIDDDLIRRVRESLDRIRPRKRLVIELFYFHDMSCREVAEFLRISHEATRAVLSRARFELRSMMMEKNTKKGTERTNRTTIVSGSRPGGAGPLYDHNSPTDRLYNALYPIGDLAEAAMKADLNADDARREAETLEKMRLIKPRGDSYRCTSPIVTASDLELILPWAKTVVSPVLEQLDDLFQKALSISESCTTQLQRSTVMMVAMLEASRRPFEPIFRELDSSAPSRGEYGCFRTATFTCDFPGGTPFHGGYGSSITDKTAAYWVWPQGIKRPHIKEFLQTLNEWSLDLKISPEDVLRRFAWIDALRASEVEPELIPASLHIPQNLRTQFRKELVAARLLDGDGNLAPDIPIVSWDTWMEYQNALDKLGDTVAEVVCDTAADLRRRAAVSSFTDCDFDDSVQVFFTVAESLVSIALLDRKWAEPPEEAAFDWGAMIVRNDGDETLLYEIGPSDAKGSTESTSGALNDALPAHFLAMPGGAAGDFAEGISIKIDSVGGTSPLFEKGTKITIHGRVHFTGDSCAQEVRIHLILDGTECGNPVTVRSEENLFTISGVVPKSSSSLDADRVRKIGIEVELTDGTRGTMIWLMPMDF